MPEWNSHISVLHFLDYFCLKYGPWPCISFLKFLIHLWPVHKYAWHTYILTFSQHMKPVNLDLCCYELYCEQSLLSVCLLALAGLSFFYFFHTACQTSTTLRSWAFPTPFPSYPLASTHYTVACLSTDTVWYHSSWINISYMAEVSSSLFLTHSALDTGSYSELYYFNWVQWINEEHMTHFTLNMCDRNTRASSKKKE